MPIIKYAEYRLIASSGDPDSCNKTTPETRTNEDFPDRKLSLNDFKKVLYLPVPRRIRGRGLNEQVLQMIPA